MYAMKGQKKMDFCVNCHLRTNHLYNIEYGHIIESYEKGIFKDPKSPDFEGP